MGARRKSRCPSWCPSSKVLLGQWQGTSALPQKSSAWKGTCADRKQESRGNGIDERKLRMRELAASGSEEWNTCWSQNKLFSGHWSAGLRVVIVE